MTNTLQQQTPNPDEVICPKCSHQFRAIPENVQARLQSIDSAAMPIESTNYWYAQADFMCVDKQDYDQLRTFAQAQSARADEIARDAELAMKALGNCYMMARRMLRKHPTNEQWNHIKRFCEETGLRPQILRASFPTEITDGDAAIAAGKGEV